MKSLLGLKFFNDKCMFRVRNELFDFVGLDEDFAKDVQLVIKRDELKKQYDQLLPYGEMSIYWVGDSEGTYDLVFKYYSLKNKAHYIMAVKETSTIMITQEMNRWVYKSVAEMEPTDKVRLYSEFSCYLDDNEDTVKDIIPAQIYRDLDMLCRAYFKKSLNVYLSCFMASIDQIHGIMPFELEIESKFSRDVVLLTDKCLYELQVIISYYLLKTYCAKYWYDVDFKTIKNDYELIRDTKTKELYVFKYLKGDFCYDRASISQAMSEDELAAFLA